VTTIAEVEKQIEALGPGTPEYHEAMAFYLMTMARAQWRQADAARLRNRRKDTLQRFKDSERAR
jgi:hypothetical protein